VIAATLETYASYGNGRQRLFLAAESPDLVVAAARLLPNLVEDSRGARTFCDSEGARDGENVGTVVEVSLTPGTGSAPPPRPPARPQGDLPPSPSPEELLGPLVASPEERERTQVNVTTLGPGPAFFIGEDVAYVSVSSGCYYVPAGGRGTIRIRFPDGRVVSAVSSGVTFELRRDGSGWTVSREVGSWIT